MNANPSKRMKILLLDIETAPNKVYAWGLWGQNIAISQIVEPGYTICFAAKWSDRKKVYFNSVHKSSAEVMVKEMHSLLSEADAIITYNGNKFDLPTMNREFVSFGIDPPEPYKSIDLYRTVRKQFRFVSNKLDYVCQQLGLGSKVEHTGMQLWKDCMDGCPKAWKLMERYNKRDVTILESLYEKLLPWIDTHPHHALYLDDDAPICRNCGSDRIIKEGYAYTNLGKYQQYSCKTCGRWGRGKRGLKSVDVR